MTRWRPGEVLIGVLRQDVSELQRDAAAVGANKTLSNARTAQVVADHAIKMAMRKARADE